MNENVPKCTKLYQNVPKHTKKYQNVPKSIKMYQNVPKYTKMYQNVPKYTKKYQNVPMYQKVPKCTNCTNIPEGQRFQLLPGIRHFALNSRIQPTNSV